MLRALREPGEQQSSSLEAPGITREGGAKHYPVVRRRRLRQRAELRWRWEIVGRFDTPHVRFSAFSSCRFVILDRPSSPLAFARS